MAVMANADIHPELRRVARLVPRQAVYTWSVPLLRRLERARKVENSGVEILTLPSGPGIRLYRPARAAQTVPALLWIHGGGYVIGTAAQDDDFCRAFTRKLGIAVAAVDYRLAPEHPYPAPLEDCYTALTWLAGLPGIDPGRIAIGGASDWPLAGAWWIRRTTSIPAITRPKAAKPCPSGLRFPPKSSSGWSPTQIKKSEVAVSGPSRAIEITPSR